METTDQPRRAESGERPPQDIGETNYLRERLSPDPADDLYLHLADLRLALDSVASSGPISILDYGCGGSPYQSLFPKGVYHRADYLEAENLDFKVAEDGRLPEVPDNTYDMVLSTQVLEHVARPEIYLGEAFRVLKPGGRLVLTTHGMFYEHGCPQDYFRWTADGLALVMERAGFRMQDIFKLTTNVRALFQLGEYWFRYVADSKATAAGLVWLAFQKFFWNNRTKRNLWIDRKFAACRMVNCTGGAKHNIYLVLMAIASKD